MAVVDVRAGYSAALEVLRGKDKAYRRLNALTASHADYVDPDRFLAEAAGAALAAAGLSRFEDKDAFWDWAVAQQPARVLVLACAAAHRLGRGDKGQAAQILERALPLDQNNLHIQGLHRRASGGRPSDAEIAGRFCRAPFENIETAPNGDVYFCCPAWLPKPIGNMYSATPEEIWNSPAARDIRASIHDGSYRYCSRVHCPKLSNLSLPRRGEVTNRRLATYARERASHLTERPLKIVLSHDRSCNLSCPSCRTGLILARKSDQDDLNRLADSIIFPLARQAEKLRLTGSGDPFGSAHFQYVLRNLDRVGNPRLRLELQTNGLLLTPRLWRELRLDGRVAGLIVSADAATPETYRIVRRGGEFNRLLENLAFLAELRREGRIPMLRLDFVVQALNWREMAGFVALARQYAADGVKFQMIRNWGTWSVEEFARHNIGAPSHPDYADFVGVLGDVLAEEPYAEFWGMAGAVRDASRRHL